MNIKEVAESLKKKLSINGTVQPVSDLNFNVRPIGNQTATIEIKGILFEVNDKTLGRSYIAILK